MDGAEPDLRNMSLEVSIESPDGDSAIRRMADVWQERCPVYLASPSQPMSRSTSAPRERTHVQGVAQRCYIDRPSPSSISPVRCGHRPAGAMTRFLPAPSA
jgi:hypothetical protein